MARTLYNQELDPEFSFLPKKMLPLTSHQEVVCLKLFLLEKRRGYSDVHGGLFGLASRVSFQPTGGSRPSAPPLPEPRPTCWPVTARSQQWLLVNERQGPKGELEVQTCVLPTSQNKSG